MSKNKAKVAIIYSSNDKQSLESRNLAFYLCGLLCRGGWAHCVMVPHCPDGPVSSLPNDKVLVLPTRQLKPVEAPGADVTFAHWSSVSDCHLVVVTVNSEDTVSCGQKLVESLGNRKTVPIFSLQRGVKQSTILSDEVESKGFTVLEAAVGFAVVLDPRNSALVSTVGSPGVVFQRLSKEEVRIADGPLRLLETMSVVSYFRKTITPHVWGICIYEHLHTLNIITKGTIHDTFVNRKHRLLYALMVRESLLALSAAAKGGGWKPEMLLICELISMKMFEMLLIMPNIIFLPMCWILGIWPNTAVISPGQLDLIEGRRTTATSTLSELVTTGEKYKQPCQLCDVVLRILQAVEAPLERGRFASTYVSDNLIDRLESKAKDLYPRHDSVDEFFFYFFRLGALVSFVFLLLFLLYHD